MLIEKCNFLFGRSTYNLTKSQKGSQIRA